MDWKKVQTMKKKLQMYMDSIPKTVDDVEVLLCSECQDVVPWYGNIQDSKVNLI